MTVWKNGTDSGIKCEKLKVDIINSNTNTGITTRTKVMHNVKNSYILHTWKDIQILLLCLGYCLIGFYTPHSSWICRSSCHMSRRRRLQRSVERKKKEKKAEFHHLLEKLWHIPDKLWGNQNTQLKSINQCYFVVKTWQKNVFLFCSVWRYKQGAPGRPQMSFSSCSNSRKLVRIHQSLWAANKFPQSVNQCTATDSPHQQGPCCCHGYGTFKPCVLDFTLPGEIVLKNHSIGSFQASVRTHVWYEKKSTHTLPHLQQIKQDRLFLPTLPPPSTAGQIWLAGPSSS